MINRSDTKDPTTATKWPNAINNRKELDMALGDGEKSGATHETIVEIADQVLTRLKNG